LCGLEPFSVRLNWSVALAFCNCCIFRGELEAAPAFAGACFVGKCSSHRRNALPVAHDGGEMPLTQATRKTALRFWVAKLTQRLRPADLAP
jgi:hypothetical protein